jgi:hypothetical protein
MKSRTKYLSAAVAVMLCGAAFSGQDDAVITFSTTADFYADGTPVKDGEFYALCWSADASFDGLTAQGEAVTAAEKVLAKIPLAKDGRCPTTVFEVDSGFVSGGYFFVYLLDTRDAAGKPATSSAALAASGVNGSVAVVSAAAAGNGTIVSQTGVDTSATPYVATDVSNVPNPTVESLTIDGDNAIIAVGNLVPYVKYNVKKGATIGEIETLGGQPLQGKDEGVTFVISKKDANFFKVVRQPVDQPLTATEE